MKYNRIAAGHYRSADGRVEIKREISQQTYRADEVCWDIIIDGRPLAMSWDSLREAKEAAARRLQQGVAH